MNILPSFLFLKWDWNSGGYAEFFVNGNRTPHGVTLCLAIFGWGFALADMSASKERFVPSIDRILWRKRRKLLLGRIICQPKPSFTYIPPKWVIRCRVLRVLGRI